MSEGIPEGSNREEGSRKSFVAKVFGVLWLIGFSIAIINFAIGLLFVLYALVTQGPSFFSDPDGVQRDRECTIIERSDGSAFDSCELLVP